MRLHLGSTRNGFMPVRARVFAQRRGMGVLYDTSPINPTTIWTPGPQGGFLNVPGDVSKGYQTTWGGPTSVYDVPGLLLPAPACSLDPDPFVSSSGACVSLLLANQQENFRRTAAYNAGTLKLGPRSTAGTGPTGVLTNAPLLSFTNNTSGDNYNFQVGDKWTIEISGGLPNSQVKVYGGKDENFSTSVMGSTDANGHFILTGTMSAAEAGVWQESWYVANSVVSTFNFRVLTPSGPAATPPAPPSGSKTAAGGGKTGGGDKTAGGGTQDTSNQPNQALYWIGGIAALGLIYAAVNR